MSCHTLPTKTHHKYALHIHIGPLADTLELATEINVQIVGVRVNNATEDVPTDRVAETDKGRALEPVSERGIFVQFTWWW